MSNELTYAKASKRLEELQYAKAQMGQLSINDEIHKKALEITIPILEQQERGEGEWVDWGGGDCPVPDMTRVDVRWQDGITSSNCEACIWEWTHMEGQENIIAYRIIPERSTNQNGEAS